MQMKDLCRWLESQGRTPAECTWKRRLLSSAKGEGRERRSAVAGLFFRKAASIAHYCES
jgi:hypothetical protein